MKTLDWSQWPDVERSPQKISGEWLFRDTRVPAIEYNQSWKEVAR